MANGKGVKPLVIAVAILVALLLAFGVYVFLSSRSHQTGFSSSDSSENTDVAVVEDNGEVTIIAVGDVLMHTPLLNYAKCSDGSYDFSNIFSQTKDEIAAADLAICNQETVIDHDIPPDGGIEFIFNSPDEIGEAEIAAGFDVVQQASNHSYDEGVNGILGTVEFWKSHASEITMVGLYSSQEERDEITVVEVNGIKIAIFNYVYGLNGFSLPSEKQYLLTVLSDANMVKICEEIAKAEEVADFTIVLPHWGVEDVVGKPVADQMKWAKAFTAAGADLIIGTHPHVCENIEWVETDNGNKALCYYSIGNFASNQQETPEVLGGMAKIKLVKRMGKVEIDASKTGVIPLVTHNKKTASFTNKVTVYKLSDYTEDLASEHAIRKQFDSSYSKSALDELAKEIFGDWIIE